MNQECNPLFWPFCKTCNLWFPDNRDLKNCMFCNTELQFKDPEIEGQFYEEDVLCSSCKKCGEIYYYNYETCPNCGGELIILNTLE